MKVSMNDIGILIQPHQPINTIMYEWTEMCIRDRVYSILEDKEGNIWLGTKDIGLFQLKSTGVSQKIGVNQKQEKIITLFTILSTSPMILTV